LFEGFKPTHCSLYSDKQGLEEVKGHTTRVGMTLDKFTDSTVSATQRSDAEMIRRQSGKRPLSALEIETSPNSEPNEDGIEVDPFLPSSTPSNDSTEKKQQSYTDHDDGHGSGAPGTASPGQVVVNIIISFVGAGLLGVPNAFSKAGWLLGSVTLCCVSALNLYALLLLPQVKRKLVSQGYEDVTSYGDLGRCILGEKGESFVNVCIGISQAGFATAYIIFIAANLYSIAEIPRWFVCAACVPGLGALCQFRDMKYLSPFSLLANCSTFFALCNVLFQDYEQYVPHNNTIHPVKWGGMIYVIAITIYSMEGVALILSLEASCKKPSMFPFLLRTVVGFITIFMAIFGSSGYLAFGDKTLTPITLNLAGHWSSTFVKLALSLSLYFTFPIMMFPVWIISETLHPVLDEDDRARFAFRFGIVCISALVAFAVPDFGKFLSLVGSSI